MLYERCSTRAFSVALGLHHRLLLPHRGPKHTGHVVRQRGHLSGIWSAVLSHSRSQTPFPSKWPGLPPAGINYSRFTGWVYLTLTEISVEALASPCPRTVVPSASSTVLVHSHVQEQNTFSLSNYYQIIQKRGEAVRVQIGYQWMATSKYSIATVWQLVAKLYLPNNFYHFYYVEISYRTTNCNHGVREYMYF